MGDVYRGKHLVTGADVAVKVLEPAAQPDETAIERFRTEVRISALLAHRSIVRVFDFLEEDDGSLALVMELLVGRTLEERLARDGALEPEVAVAIALPILNALEHAHAVGVIHRDVKPANVFLAVEPDGRVTPKLLDFGVAKSAASHVKTLDGQVLGTSRYMSPEQARGQPLDGRSDLFSVAAVLYEAMTGSSPFAASDATGALTKVLELTVDADDRIPPRVWLAIQKSLSKQPYARHATAGAFASELVAALGKGEDELARLLHEERPPLPHLETPNVAIAHAALRTPTRQVWPVAVGLTLLASAVVIAALLLHREETQAPVTSAPPTASQSVAPPSNVVAAPSVAASTSATHIARTVPPTTSRSPKPVATTPGF